MKRIWLIVAGVILVLGLLVGLCSFTKIPTGHTGIVTSFGKVLDVTLDSGIHAKAPWQSVIKMDNRIQRATETLSCFSADIQEVNMQYTLNYQINSANAMTIYRTIGKDYYEKVIVPTVKEAVKVCVAKYTAEQLIAERVELALAVEKVLTEDLEPYNIIINATSIEDIDFTDAFTTAVEAKQVAQQNKLKAETEAQQKIVEAEAAANVKKVEADAQAYEMVKKAEAEAQAYELVSNSLTDKILSKMYYERWNGQLPEVVTGESTLLTVPYK